MNPTIDSESDVPAYLLPDLLTTRDGSGVTTAAQWRARRRPELLDDFARTVYGRTPTGEVAARLRTDTSTTVFDGAAERRELTLTLERSGYSIDLHLLVYLPTGSSVAGTSSAAPAFLGLNFGGNHTVDADPAVRLSTSYTIARRESDGHQPTDASRGTAASRWPVREITRRGYAVVTAHCGDVDPDYHDGFSNGVHPLLDPPQRDRESWGTIGGWAWGLSRMLDAVARVDAIDERRVFAIGHSRLGKAALWAAAQDERFAGVVSSCSGCGGAALYRRRFGERIAHITSTFPHWFCAAHTEFAERESELPVDMHELLALIAPRYLHVGSASEDLWADPHGEYLAARHADAAYRLLGVDGFGSVVRYHRRDGGHDITPEDWSAYLDHADAYLASRSSV